MRKYLFLSLVLMLLGHSLNANIETNLSAINQGEVRFALQNVKAIGEELRFYFLITNTGDKDTTLMIRANEHKLYDGKGNEFTSSMLIIGDKKMKGSSFDTKTYIKDIPIKACIIFNTNNVSELTLVKLLQIKVNKSAIRLNNIQIPLPALGKNTIEIENDLILQITEIKAEGEHLRLHFILVNKSAQDIQVTFRGNNQRIVDNSATEFTSNAVEFASQRRTGTSMVSSTMVKDVPIKGYFEFPNAAAVKQILLFEMKTFQNNFRMKNL